MDWKLILQIAGVLLGLLYLWLEYRADIRLWIVGLVMPLVHGALYYKAGLYADCSMQVYYVLAGLYGLARVAQEAETDAGLHRPWRCGGRKAGRRAAHRPHAPADRSRRSRGSTPRRTSGIYLLLVPASPTAPCPSGTR